MITNSVKLPTRPVQSAVSAVLLAAGVLGAGPASAFDFDMGDWDASWDTTLSYGQLWRVEDRDLRLIGVANGGTGRSPNIDDGNLNYDTGIVSNAAKFVTELSLSRHNYGVFLRAQGLYDYEVENRDTERELTFNAGSTPPFVSGSWVGLEIPLSDFMDNTIGLVSRAHLAQLIMSSDTGTVYVDNVYFHK